MAQAGYSGTPLIKKLGIDRASKLLLVNEPPDYFDWFDSTVKSKICTAKEKPDIVHLFAKDQNEFERSMQKILPLCRLNPSIVVWISWYKQAAKIPTDLTEDVIRLYALQHDLVDVKVCAVSEQWSGLKLVVPLAKR